MDRKQKEEQVIKELNKKGLNTDFIKNMIYMFTGIPEEKVEFKKVADKYELNIQTRLRPEEGQFLDDWYLNKTKDELAELDKSSIVRFTFKADELEESNEEVKSEKGMEIAKQAVKEIEELDQYFLSDDRIKEYVDEHALEIYQEKDLEKDASAVYQDKLLNVEIKGLDTAGDLKYTIYFKDGNKKDGRIAILVLPHVADRFQEEDMYDYLKEELKKGISRRIIKDMEKGN